MINVVVFAKLEPGATLPEYQSHEAAGLDLVALKGRSLMPGERAAIPTGVSVEIPRGYEGQVRPRSGLALKTGLTVLNAPGTIDSDYRGEIKVLLVNTSNDTAEIATGDRIAQLVIAPVCWATLEVVDTLAATERGAGGFGSTGGTAP